MNNKFGTREKISCPIFLCYLIKIPNIFIFIKINILGIFKIANKVKNRARYIVLCPIYHFDVYRLDGTEDFINLGADDMLYGDGVSIIEWSEKIMEELPSNTIILRLTPQADGSRLIEIENWNNGEIK